MIKDHTYVDIDYEWLVFAPEILRAQNSLKLCKLGKETRREWGETGKNPTTEVSLLFKFPFLRNGKYRLDTYLSIC